MWPGASGAKGFHYLVSMLLMEFENHRLCLLLLLVFDKFKLCLCATNVVGLAFGLCPFGLFLLLAAYRLSPASQPF